MIHISENKNQNYIKTNKNIKGITKTKTPVLKDVKSSIYTLEAQGRALVNSPKLSFKGSVIDFCLEEYLVENTDLSEYTIKEILKLTPEKRKEALDLYQEGIIPESLLTTAIQKEPEIKEKMLETIRKGISAKYAIQDVCKIYNGEKSIELDKNLLMQRYNKIIDFINNGIDTDSINMLLAENLELQEESLQKISYFLNKLKSSPAIMVKNRNNMYELAEIATSDDEKYQKAVKLFDMGITDLCAIASLIETEDKYQRGIKLFNAGYEGGDLASLTEIDDDEVRFQIQELMKKYSISATYASTILNFESDRKETALRKLSACNIRPDVKFLKLPDELLDSVIQLFEEGYSEAKILSVMNFDYENKALKEFIDKDKENNVRWNEFIQHNAYRGKEFSKQDIIFLKEHVFSSEFYSPDEYINAFLYLKNLKTINNENILGSESFINRIKTNGLGDFASKQEDMMYRNLEALLCVDPTSKKAEYIKKILELIQKGKVNPSAFRKLCDLNDLKSAEEILFGLDFGLKPKTSSWDISNNLADDIELLGNADFDDENYIDKYIPSYKNEQEGIRNSKIGDAFVPDGEKYIRIKVDENSSKTVKLTKETYARLFPPVDRFLTSQQIMGNCYCIETLMSLYCNNGTRIDLLKMMEEDDNGNITIKMGNYEPVIFKKGELPKNELLEIYSSGADGYKLFEYAYSCALVEDKIKEAQANLSGNKLVEFNDFIKSNPDDFFIYKENGEIKWSSYTQTTNENVQELLGMKTYKTFNNFLLGNGGLQNDVYKKIGYNSKFYIGGALFENYSKKDIIAQYREAGIYVDNVSTLNKAKRLLNTPDYFKNHQVQIGLGMHAYCLTQEKDDKGRLMYYLYNPHNQGFPIKFDCLNDLLSKTTTVTIIETDKDKKIDIESKPAFQTIAENRYILRQKISNNQTLENIDITELETKNNPKYKKTP